MAPAPHILVAGAGIAGLATAIALARRGLTISVLEQRTVMSEAGAGIQIGPNGVKALAALGLRAGIERAAFQPQGIGLFNGPRGKRLTRLPLGDWAEHRFGAPFLTLSRARLQAELLAGAKAETGIELRLGFEVARVTSASGAVVVQSADGRTAQGSALIGADGLWSRVRQLRGGPAPRPAGYDAYRAQIMREGPGFRLPEPFAAPDIGLWLGPDAHIVHYPIEAGDRLNVVVIVAADRPSPEWDQPGRLANLTPHVARWSPGMQALLRLAPVWRRWSLFELDPWPRRARDNVALMGDAAHPMLPFLAQGAVMALEDAVVMGQALAAAGADIGAAFARFEEARGARVARVVAASRRNGQTYHMGGLGAVARDAVLGMAPPARLMSQYDWLFGFDPLAGGA